MKTPQLRAAQTHSNFLQGKHTSTFKDTLWLNVGHDNMLQIEKQV